jgi:hypothetical protein
MEKAGPGSSGSALDRGPGSNEMPDSALRTAAFPLGCGRRRRVRELVVGRPRMHQGRTAAATAYLPITTRDLATHAPTRAQSGIEIPGANAKFQPSTGLSAMTLSLYCARSGDPDDRARQCPRSECPESSPRPEALCTSRPVRRPRRVVAIPCWLSERALR